MSITTGNLCESAVVTRLRSELKKTVLEAPKPRVLVDLVPTSGGYGETVPATDIPENWGAGRITTTHDELCPVVPLHLFVDLVSGDYSGDDDPLSPFVPDDLRDRRLDSSAERLHGCGLIGVAVSTPTGDLDPNYTTSGTDSDVGMPLEVRCVIYVPANRGTGQGALYSGILHRVFYEAVLPLDDPNVLEFQTVPLLAPVAETSDEWLVFDWVANAMINFTQDYPFSG